ncbi:hypothetical protein K1T71_008537 [Dendrolimus kikuchii]|uniref:Uncharacterized protein n=1 Tax=Dendrolimus kikuchii TaxID=765133 RepID=A0ACC1CV10_9NEOP|nr:hypothetical protein K1T71_008537 [Dendrolimus kikuchii]
MDSADALLGDLASGDSAPAMEPQHVAPAMKRDQDSTDDFEHLDREAKLDAGESPQHHHRAATQNFLEMERDLLSGTPLVPTSVKQEHLADKFTDSESDADTAGESPMHRPPQPKPSAPTPEPPAPAPAPEVHAIIPEIPAHAPASVPTPTVVIKPPEVKPVPVEVAPPVVEPPAPAPAAAPNTQPAASKPEQTPQPKPAAVEPARPTPTAHIIEAEVIFCQMGLDAWFDPQRLHPEVESLIYWRNAGRSGAALGAGLALLVALACCSVVSVLAYASLLALSAAVAFRIYKNVLQAVQKTNDGHPFKWLLEHNISVDAERAQSAAAAATAHINAALHELRRLFLVEDLVDSLKFGVLLWCLTYVGACFNGITLIILGWIALFTLPKAYEMNKAQVDANLELARAKINDITAKVRAAVPLGRKAESEKDK